MSVQLKREPYEPVKLNLLLRQVKIATEQGQYLEYEILMDDFVVIPRNSDPERFNLYVDFIGSATKTITVALYRDSGRAFEKYIFDLQGPPKSKSENLGEIPEGLSLSEWEEKQKEKWKRELRYDELEKENAKLQGELEKKDKAIKEYGEKFSELKEGKLLGISEIGASILMGVLKHPKVQENFPALSGFAEATAKKEAVEPVTFVRKGENQPEVKEEVAEILTEEEQGYLKFVRDLEQNVTRPQFENIMHVIQQLVNNPTAIGSTLKHISNFLNSKPKENDEKV